MALADVQVRLGMRLGTQKLLADLESTDIPFERTRDGAYWTSDTFTPREGAADDPLYTAAIVIVFDSSESRDAILRSLIEALNSQL